MRSRACLASFLSENRIPCVFQATPWAHIRVIGDLFFSFVMYFYLSGMCALHNCDSVIPRQHPAAISVFEADQRPLVAIARTLYEVACARPYLRRALIRLLAEERKGMTCPAGKRIRISSIEFCSEGNVSTAKPVAFAFGEAMQHREFIQLARFFDEPLEGLDGGSTAGGGPVPRTAPHRSGFGRTLGPFRRTSPLFRPGFSFLRLVPPFARAPLHLLAALLSLNALLGALALIG